MHIYIYDPYVSEKKFDSTLARIETRITDLGLNGKINRLNVMTSVHDVVENEVKKGAKTIIAVGNDRLLNQVINSLSKLASQNILSKDVPLGFIPVGKKNNTIAPFLGINLEEEACDILSARRIKNFDLGIANDTYLLAQAIITSRGTIIEIDKDYSIEILKDGIVGIINLPTDKDLPQEVNIKANDGVLELFIKTKTTNKFLPLAQKTDQSIFSFKKLRITNKHHPVLIDNSLEIKTPVDITIAREKINIIVGRQRKV